MVLYSKDGFVPRIWTRRLSWAYLTSIGIDKAFATGIDVFATDDIYEKHSNGIKSSWFMIIHKKYQLTNMKILSQLYIFSNLYCAGLAHGDANLADGIQNNQAMINRFKSFMEPENLYAKRNMSPLDGLFENSVISKRSYENAMKTTDRSFFQQLGNVLTAPFKHNLWTFLFNKLLQVEKKCGINC